MAGGAIPSKTKQELANLQSQLDLARAEGRAVQAVAEQLQRQVAALSQQLAETDDRQTTVAASLQDASQSLADTVAAQVAGLRRELLKPPEVSLAEFARVQSMAGAAVEEARAAARTVTTVQVWVRMLRV